MRPITAALLLLLAYIALAPCARAGDPPPPSLKGQTFDISFLTEKGKPHDKLVIDGDSAAACMGLGAAKVPLVCKYHDRKGKVIDFSGKLTDAKGGVIEISGSLTGTDIHGSITITPKDEDPKARNFSGTQLAK